MGEGKKLRALVVVLLLIAFIFYGKNWSSNNLFFDYVDKENRTVKDSLIFEGISRTYLFHLPPDYNGESPVPLVFVLHGAGGNAEIIAGTSGMNDIADKNGFITVYPNGTGLFSDFFLSWNAGECCNFIGTPGVNDTDYINFLIDKFEKEYNIDKKKIYIAGMSNGGMMAYKMACESADKIAAIAPVSAVMYVNEKCEPSEPVSVVAINDANDDVIPYSGGESSDFIVKYFHLQYKPVLESIYFWSDNNNCKNQSEMVTGSVVYRDLFSDCDNNTEVLFYLSSEGGHSWPGGEKSWFLGSEPTQSISASQIIWDFFLSHPKK